MEKLIKKIKKDKIVNKESYIKVLLRFKKDYQEQVVTICKLIDELEKEIGFYMTHEICSDETNPFGVCVYSDHDEAREHCLFCGEPEVRK